MEDLIKMTVMDSVYSPVEMLVNMALACLLGVIIAVVYRKTHKGLSYSQSFTLTLVFVAAIVSIIMMVIGSSLARAFALVGAMSIIRFRTVVKDTKDTAFVFASLAMGMAAGTGNYFLAIMGTVFISGLAGILYKTNFGVTTKSEFIIRFVFEKIRQTEKYLAVMEDCTRWNNLLHAEPSGDGQYLTLTYDLALKQGITANSLAEKINNVEGISEVSVISARNEVDY